MTGYLWLILDTEDMTLTLFGIMVGSFTIGLSGALMPGPLLTVAVSDSARRGFIAGPLLVLGHGILELALVIAIVIGAASYLKQAVVTSTVSIAGGAVLFWMGLGMVMQSRQINLPVNRPVQEGGRLTCGIHPVLAGIVVSLSNPYWLIWWLTIGLGYMLLAMKYGVMGISSFFVGHIMADLIWYSLVSFGVSRGRGFFSDRLYRGIVRFCGFFLILFGSWFLSLGIRYFF